MINKMFQPGFKPFNILQACKLSFIFKPRLSKSGRKDGKESIFPNTNPKQYQNMCSALRDGGWWGAVYLYIHVMPDEFSFQIKFKLVNLKRNLSGNILIYAV